MAEAEPVPFWRSKALAEMTEAEWESLCDGCGRCCLGQARGRRQRRHRLHQRRVPPARPKGVPVQALRQAHRDRRRLRGAHRRDPAVAVVAAADLRLPAVDEGDDLYWWHPLVSGDPDTVHAAGISVRGRTVGENQAGDYEDHIVTWPTDGLEK